MKIELIQQYEIQETCEMIARSCQNSVFSGFYPPLPEFFSIPHQEVKEKAEYGHFYVVKENDRIIGCGGIGAYWGNLTESWINTVFVDPAYQGKGIGRTILAFLEKDMYAKRATRIEIHSAISSIPFYRKLGYEHKNGQLSYHDGMFDLEKFTESCWS